MNKAEVKRAVELSKVRVNIPFSDTNLELFNGFALKDFKPVNVTLVDVADLIRWQCSMFNGGFDTEALNEIVSHGKNKFIVIG